VTPASAPVLVLGIGNVLLGDDGVGVRVVTELARLVEQGGATVSPDTRLVDGGTLGRDLLPLVRGAAALIVVDAAELDAVPGTVHVLRDEEIGQGHSPGAIDRGGLLDLLIAATIAGDLPDRLALVGVEPDTITTGLALSPSVEAAVPRAIGLVLGELEWLCAEAVA
jgi:hydrogenase maturation protease